MSFLQGDIPTLVRILLTPFPHPLLLSFRFADHSLIRTSHPSGFGSFETLVSL